MKAIVENVALTANLEKSNAFVCILNVINLSKMKMIYVPT